MGGSIANVVLKGDFDSICIVLSDVVIKNVPRLVQATRYEGYYVFFPSIYWHFSTKAVNGLPNDGVRDHTVAL